MKRVAGVVLIQQSKGAKLSGILHKIRSKVKYYGADDSSTSSNSGLEQRVDGIGAHLSWGTGFCLH